MVNELMMLILHNSVTYSFSASCDIECHENAQCLVDEGGAQCECNEGYSGNGITCSGKRQAMVNVHTSATIFFPLFPRHR